MVGVNETESGEQENTGTDGSRLFRVYGEDIKSRVANNKTAVPAKWALAFSRKWS